MEVKAINILRQKCRGRKLAAALFSLKFKWFLPAMHIYFQRQHRHFFKGATK
jgi:hypothetical protein